MDHYKLLPETNFQTSNIVLVVYRRQAGGKFLINCLGLSNQCYLQDMKLINQQRAGRLNQENKFNLLMSRLDEFESALLINKNILWRDLRLGCAQVFKYTSDVVTISREDNLFFKVCHGKEAFDKDIKQWPNAQVIEFINSSKFVNWRYRPNYVFSDDNSRFQVSNCKVWDNNHYFDKTLTIESVKELYRSFGLSDFNAEYISKYYTKWIQVLDLQRKLHNV